MDTAEYVPGEECAPHRERAKLIYTWTYSLFLAFAHPLSQRQATRSSANMSEKMGAPEVLERVDSMRDLKVCVSGTKQPSVETVTHASV